MAERKRTKEITEPVSITVNGEELTVQRGELLIEACERNGEYIPRFCHHSRMNPVGMCRMCLVDVDAGRGAALQPSCMVECGDGMVVDTENESVKKAQNGVLEFLLVNHPLDCPVCDKGGECPLQDHTMSFGPGESRRMVEEKRHFAKPITISETINLDRERCILCDRCTRFADEVAGDSLIHFIDRGSQTQVNTFPDAPFSSYFSGNTVQICPVGALTAKPFRFKARPWDLQEVESTCTTCSVGCRIAVESSRDEVLRYSGVDSDPINWGWLCDKGRFGFEAVNSDGRLQTPLHRDGDNTTELRWSDALDTAAQMIQGGMDRGASSVAVLGGARSSNESAYAWARLAKGVIGTDHVDAQLGDGLSAAFVTSLELATLDEVCTPGATIITLAPDPKEELAVAYLRFKHAVQEDGATLIELTPRPSGLTPYASASLTYAPGEAASAVQALFASGEGSGFSGDTAQLEAARSALSAASGPISIVIGRPSLAESAQTIELAAMALREAAPEARFLVALPRANVRGAIDMGLAPGLVAGRVKAADASEALVSVWGELPQFEGGDATAILTAAAEGKIETLVLLGADPLADFPDSALAERALSGARNVISLDAFENASNRKANLVLPVAITPEISGTTTNFEGRVTTLSSAVTPSPTTRSDWEVAVELAARLGSPFSYLDAADITAEISEVSQLHHGVTAEALKSNDLIDGIVVPLDDSNAPTLNTFTATEVALSPRDAYSFRLVATRRMYGGGTMLANSPSSANLGSKTVLLLNPGDFDKAGLAADDGTPTGRAKLTAAQRSVTLDALPDASVPKGVAHVVINQGDADVASIVDATAAVTEVRLEVANK